MSTPGGPEPQRSIRSMRLHCSALEEVVVNEESGTEGHAAASRDLGIGINEEVKTAGCAPSCASSAFSTASG